MRALQYLCNPLEFPQIDSNTLKCFLPIVVAVVILHDIYHIYYPQRRTFLTDSLPANVNSNK